MPFPMGDVEMHGMCSSAWCTHSRRCWLGLKSLVSDCL